MKIAFFVHCFFPDHFYGTETYTLELARHYQSWGHDVTVVSAIFQGEASASELITHYKYAGIPVISIDKNQIPHSRVKETYYQADMRSVMEKLLADLTPDLVHVTHLINHTAVLLEVTRQLGIPTYGTFTDFFGFCLNNKLEAADGELCSGPSPSRTNCLACHLKDAARNPQAEGWIRHATTTHRAQWIATAAHAVRKLPGLRGGSVEGLIQDIARRPDTLITLYNNTYKAAIAPTKFLKSAYASNGIHVPLHDVWFGVDIDRKAKPIRNSNHRPVIGFIGQIAPHKGTDLLIEAFRRMPKGKSELRIYGPTDQDPKHMEVLKTMATGHDVHFMGIFQKEKMAEVLETFDLLVIPSRWYENSPLVLLNALATHTPVLVSNVAGMTEFLEPGINGDSFERGNVDDLEIKLTALIQSSEFLYSLANTTKYERTSEAMALETFKIYEFL